jgi:integrase
MGDGQVFKRCECRHPQTGRPINGRCPRLTERGHGSWYFDCAVQSLTGRQERIRRGGYTTRRDAAAARDTVIDRSDSVRAAGALTVAHWLRYWLTTRTSLRPTTLRSYISHVEVHLIPHLGRIRLADLTGRHIAAMFRALAGAESRTGRRPTPATLHGLRATLRAALNGAVRAGLRTDNPARHVELPGAAPPTRRGVDRSARGRVESERRPATGSGMDRPAAHRVPRLRRRRPAPADVVADRPAGLRRGEAAGLRWCDVDLDAATIYIEQQRLADGRTVANGPPKTAASRRAIALDTATVQTLRAHRHRQQTAHASAGIEKHDAGYVFTTPTGQPLHPDLVTRRFRRLVTLSGLPPVRLHDLRHGAASLALAAGTDLKTVQAMLGHQHRAHRRHLHQRPTRPADHRRREHGTSGPRDRRPQPRPTQLPRRQSPRKSAAPPPGMRPEPVRANRFHRRRKGRDTRPLTSHPRPTKIKAA